MTAVDCLECAQLDRALELTLASYRAARSAAFYQVCTDIAAKREVDMERAKNDLQEHRLVCPFVMRAKAADRVGELSRPVDTADPKAK